MRGLVWTLAIVIVARATAAAGPCGEASGCAVTAPEVFLELGAGVRRFGRMLGPATLARATVPVVDRQTAVVGTTRIGLHGPHGMTALTELSIGGERGDGAFVLETLVALGVGGAVPIGRLGVELAFGQRTAATQTASNQVALLEARVVVTTWLAPRISLDAVVGSGLLERGAWTTGILVGFHAYPHDRE